MKDIDTESMLDVNSNRARKNCLLIQKTPRNIVSWSKFVQTHIFKGQRDGRLTSYGNQAVDQTIV